MSKKKENKNKDQFDIQHSKVSAEDIQKEILYNLQLNNAIAEKTRANTNTLITYLIVIPLLVGLAIMVFSMPAMK